MVLIDDVNLELSAAIKIAAQLWKHVHRTDAFSFKQGFRICTTHWYFLEGVCLENIKELKLPKRLNAKVKAIIKPIGYEIIKFYHNHIRNIRGNEFIQQRLINTVWTARGTVDTKRSLKVLINDEKIDLTFRYRLACYCCLENSITILWNQMSEKQKSYFLNHEFFCKDSYVEHIWSLQKGNPIALREDASKAGFSCIYEYAFIQSVREYNKDAVLFFWKKLGAEVRNSVLLKALKLVNKRTGVRCFGIIYHICERNEVVSFLLSQAEENSLENAMQKLDGSVLTCLLEWPCQKHYLDILDTIQLSVGSKIFYDVTEKLVCNIFFGYQDFNYASLLKQLLKKRMKFPKQFDGYKLRTILDSRAVSVIASYCEKELRTDFSENIFETLSDDEEWEFVTFIIDKIFLKTKHKIFQPTYKPPSRHPVYEYYIRNATMPYKIQSFLEVLIKNKIEILQNN